MELKFEAGLELFREFTAEAECQIPSGRILVKNQTVAQFWACPSQLIAEHTGTQTATSNSVFWCFVKEKFLESYSQGTSRLIAGTRREGRQQIANGDEEEGLGAQLVHPKAVERALRNETGGAFLHPRNVAIVFRSERGRIRAHLALQWRRENLRS